MQKKSTLLEQTSACCALLINIFFVSLGLWHWFVLSVYTGVPAAGVALFHSESSSGMCTDGGEGSSPHVVTAPWHFCFEDKCRCRGQEADCSHNEGRLPFIPGLPEGIRRLNFSSNLLTTIPRGNFFFNVTDIAWLDLSNNELTFIHPNAFKALTKLSCLFLNNNRELTYVKLHPVFSVPTLEHLHLSGLNLGRIPRQLFHEYNFTRLRKLEMCGNELMSGDLSTFAQLLNLQGLGLGSNDISSVMTDTVLQLHSLTLDHNLLSEFPNSCKNNVSLFPHLKLLVLQHNAISSIPSLICFPALSFLDLNKNMFSALLVNSFNVARFPKLIKLDLGSTREPFYIEQDAFNNSVLETVSLAGNLLSISDDDVVNPFSFRGCNNLSTLILRDNRLNRISERKIRLLFSVLPLLQTLDLSSGFIKKIPNFTFAVFPKLQQLSLRDNQIQVLPDGVLDMVENLTSLDLSRNWFFLVQESAFSETTRTRLRHLDLSGNSFECSCKLMWFRQWFVSQPSLFNNSHDQYTCTHELDSGKVPLETFYLDKQACLLPGVVYEILTWYLFQLELIFIIVVIVFFVRSRLKTPLLIRAFRGRENGIRFAANVNYVYDIFVAYAEEDSQWIRHHLMPMLEGRLGLKLCLHERDFHPGRNILDNIEDSVEKSRKAMMIFSTHFAHSHWCQFELSLCQRHVMDNEDVLVVICMEDVQPREWTSGMMAILRTSTYIRWSQEPQHRAGFWNIVTTALQDVIRPAAPPV